MDQDQGYLWAEVQEYLKDLDPERLIILLTANPQYVLWDRAQGHDIPRIKKALEKLDPANPQELKALVREYNRTDNIFIQAHKVITGLDEVSRGAILTGEHEGQAGVWEIEDEDPEPEPGDYEPEGD